MAGSDPRALRRDAWPPSGGRNDDGFDEAALALDRCYLDLPLGLDAGLIGPGTLGKSFRQNADMRIGSGRRLVLGVEVVQPLAGIQSEKPDLRLADARFR